MLDLDLEMMVSQQFLCSDFSCRSERLNAIDLEVTIGAVKGKPHERVPVNQVKDDD